MNKQTLALAAIAAVAIAGGAAFAASRTNDMGADAGAQSLDDIFKDDTTDTTGASTIMSTTNLQAFLNTIAKAEGTANGANPYAVCFGYKHTIQDFSEHPAITGEWKGEPLGAKMCLAAGHLPGCVSTAAGKFQIIKPTWTGLRDKLGLDDFSPASQDAAAEELLRQCGALPLILEGDIEGAIVKARKIWASFPASGYQQGERTVAWMVNQFEAAGGNVA